MQITTKIIITTNKETKSRTKNISIKIRKKLNISKRSEHKPTDIYLF